MKTITKYALLIITAIILMSCNLNFTGVKGNGEVTTTTRFSGKDFTSIKASEGLNVVLTQSNNTLVKVQADSNLQDLIITEIKDGVLILHTEKQIGKASAKKVLVHFTNLKTVKTNSGADVYTANAIKLDNIKLEASSGSQLTLNLSTQNIICSASSGAAINLTGKTNTFTASASSGSNIDADGLIAEKCTSKASSGASVDVNCKQAIDAKVSSGANIEYKGNPTEVKKSKSSGGSISATE